MIYARTIYKVDSLQVVRSVEDTPILCKGVWRVARSLHRGSRMGMSSQMAESWASILGRQYDGVTGLSSGSILSRALLRIGGFRGNGNDDHIVQVVARQLKGNFVHSDRSRRGSKQAGLSCQDIAEITLMKQLGWMNNNACNLLVSSGAVKVSEQMVEQIDRKMHLSSWRVQKNLWTADFDCTKIAEADLKVFQAFDSSTRPSLPLMSMTRNQRLRFNQLALSERRKRRALYLAESLKKVLARSSQQVKVKGKKQLPLCVRQRI